MPKKFTSTISSRVGVQGESFYKSITVYFSPEWDEFYYESYSNEKEQQKSQEKLLINLTLKLNLAQESDSLQHIELPGNNLRPAIVYTQACAASEYYVHRVAIRYRSTGIDYQLLCCCAEKVEIVTILQTELDALRNDLMFSFRADEGAYRLSEALSYELQGKSAQLRENIDAYENLAFINFFNSQLSFRIVEPLAYPKQGLCEMDFNQVYCAALPRFYPLFYLFQREFSVETLQLTLIGEQFYQIKDATAIAEHHVTYTRFKDSLQAVKMQTGRIISGLKAIVDQKIEASKTLHLLKARYIWVLQESARAYYVSLRKERKAREEAAENPLNVVHKFNAKFSDIAEMSHLCRISFKDITHTSVEELAQLYNNILQRTKGRVTKSSRAYPLLMQNMQIVHHEPEQNTLFTFSPMGFIGTTPAFSALLDQANPSLVSTFYYPNEMNIVMENRELLNEFFNFNVLEDLSEDEAKQCITDKMTAVKENILSFVQVVEARLAAEKREQQEAEDKAKEEKSERYIADKRQRDRENRCLDILHLVDTILSQPFWWHQQLRGCCPGSRVPLGAKVPRGIALMCRLKETRPLLESTTESLERYQQIAQRRLAKRTFATFFPIRVKETTKRFYDWLDKMDVHNPSVEYQVENHATGVNFLTRISPALTNANGPALASADANAPAPSAVPVPSMLASASARPGASTTGSSQSDASASNAPNASGIPSTPSAVSVPVSEHARLSSPPHP